MPVVQEEMAMVPYGQTGTAQVKRHAERIIEQVYAQKLIAEDPTGAGRKVAEIAFSIMLPDQSDVPVRFGGLSSVGTVTYDIQNTVTPDWPQQQAVYPGKAGQFMVSSTGGLPISTGPNGSPEQLVIYGFRDELCEWIIENFNSKGSFIPYMWYSQTGSVDFEVNAGGTGADGITEKLIPAYAVYDPTLVSGGNGSPGSNALNIYQPTVGATLKRLTTNTRTNPSTPLASHGPVLAPGQYRGDYWLYCDANNSRGNAVARTVEQAAFTATDPATVLTDSADVVATSMIVVVAGTNWATAMPSGSQYTINLWRRNQGNPRHAATVSAITSQTYLPGSQLAVFAVPEDDDYRIEIRAQAALAVASGQSSIANFRVFQVSASHSWSHLIQSELQTAWNTISAIQGFGRAIWVQNKTQFNYLGGDIIGYQPPLNVDWYTPVDSSEASNAFEWITAQGAQSKETKVDPWDLARGGYGYLKPVSRNEMMLKPSIDKLTAGGPISNAVPYSVDLEYDLHDRAFFMFVLRAPTPQASVPLQQINLNLFATGAYVDRSPYRESRRSVYTEQNWEDAVEIVKGSGQFFDNHTHVERIKSVISSLGAYVNKGVEVANIIGKYARMFFPSLNRAIDEVNTAIRS